MKSEDIRGITRKFHFEYNIHVFLMQNHHKKKRLSDASVGYLYHFTIMTGHDAFFITL